MKVLITGGAGFIGSHLVDACLARGWAVVVVDSLDPGVHRAIPNYLRPAAEYCFVDLRHWNADDRCAGVTAVVNLAALGGVARAAREPGNIIAANAVGTARLLEQARTWPTLRRFIQISSFSVYGANYSYYCNSCRLTTGAGRDERDLAAGRFEVNCPKCGQPAAILPITPQATPAPLETYGASKYMQELALSGFDRERLAILRLSSVYGSRMRWHDSEATIIARLAGWIAVGEPPTLFEDGQQLRDWVHVGDVADAVVNLIAGAPAPPLVNVCSGEPLTLIEACAALAAAAGVECPPRIVGGYRPGDMRHCLGDPAEFKTLLGRNPLKFDQGAGSLINGAGNYSPTHCGGVAAMDH